MGPHDHKLLKLTPRKPSPHICQSSVTPYQFLRCPNGRMISAVSFACYGAPPSGSCGAFKLGACGVDVKTAAAHCVGKSQCGMGEGLGPTALPSSKCTRPELFATYSCA